MNQFADCVISYQVQRAYVKYINDTQQLYVANLLLWKSVNGFSEQKSFLKQQFRVCDYRRSNQTQQNMPKLIELLQKSAVEYLSTFQQFQAQYLRQIGSLFKIVTTDFEAL